MATRKFKILDYSLSPEARPFAGTEVTISLNTEKDLVHVLMSRKHAEALRDQLTDALRTLDQIAASVGVGPKG